MGECKPGDRLPTLDELAEEFGVARLTARRAIALLEQDGLVWRRQGKGTFVSDNVITGPWFSVETEWSELVRMVGQTSFRQIGSEAAMPPLKPSDGVSGSQYHCFRRVYAKDDAPYATISIYLEQETYAKAPALFATRPAVVVLDDLPGVRITSARQQLTIGTADAELAQLLHVPLNSPVAEIRRVITDERDVVIYLAEIRYRGDFVKLDIKLR